MVRLEPKTLTRRRCASFARLPLRAPGGLRRHALIVGTSRHRHRPFSSLTSPALDLAGLHALLTAPEIGGFEARPPLADQPAFELNMELESFFREREPDDLLLLYLGGHVLVDEHGALSLISHGTDRGRWRSSTIDFSFLRDVMQPCGAERQALILDACIGAVGAGSPALGATIDLDAVLGGPGRVVLAASNRVRFRLEGDAISGDPNATPVMPRLVQGLRDGAADVDGDGRVSFDDLSRYVLSRCGDAGAPPSGALPPGGCGHDVRGTIVIARTTAATRQAAASMAVPAERRSSTPPRPGLPRRRNWASSVASWLAQHVGR